MKRVGDTATCPACGISMNAEAYRCPNCKIYFCYRCRRRVSQNDEQFQCLNHQCAIHAKLICVSCSPEKVVAEDIERETQVEYVPNFVSTIEMAMGVASVLFALVSLFAFAQWSVIGTFGTFGIVLSLIFAIGFSFWYVPLIYFFVFGIPRTLLRRWYTEQRTESRVESVEVSRYRECIECKAPVEILA